MTSSAITMIDVKTPSERPTLIGPTENFTGVVFLDELIKAADPSRLNAILVTFTPGARTSWHSHRFRQILFVTVGSGFVQIKGQIARPLQPGDVTVIPPDVEHWHGASHESLFAHLALLESEGLETNWFDPVPEEHYASFHRGHGTRA